MERSLFFFWFRCFYSRFHRLRQTKSTANDGDDNRDRPASLASPYRSIPSPTVFCFLFFKFKIFFWGWGGPPVSIFGIQNLGFCLFFFLNFFWLLLSNDQSVASLSTNHGLASASDAKDATRCSSYSITRKPIRAADLRPTRRTPSIAFQHPRRFLDEKNKQTNKQTIDDAKRVNRKPRIPIFPVWKSTFNRPDLAANGLFPVLVFFLPSFTGFQYTTFSGAPLAFIDLCRQVIIVRVMDMLRLWTVFLRASIDL